MVDRKHCHLGVRLKNKDRRMSVLVELLPVFIVLACLVGIIIVVKAFKLPKNYHEIKNTRELIIKQKKKKAELEKLQSSMYDEE